MEDVIKTNRKEYERLLRDGDYTDVRFNPQNGGLAAIHQGHRKSNPKEETYFNGLTSIDLEKECQNILFRNGYRCILEKEGIRGANGQFVTTLDSKTNGVAMDIKSATKNVPHYRNMLDEKNIQLGKYNSRKDVVKSGSVILYFHDSSFYYKQKVIDGVMALNKLLEVKNRANHINEIVCVVSDGRVEHFDYK